MDNELIAAGKQAVILIVIGFIISISWITVAMGQIIYRDINNTINNGMSYAYSSELEAIAEYNGDIPAASLYIALEKNKDLIDQQYGISGYVDGTSISDLDDIKKILSYQVYIDITIVNDYYYVYIYD